MRFIVGVEPDAENCIAHQKSKRRLFARSRQVLDVRRSKRLHTVEFKGLPAGDYTLARAGRLFAMRVLPGHRERLGGVPAWDSQTFQRLGFALPYSLGEAFTAACREITNRF